MAPVYPVITLKPKRESPLKNRHHAVFSGAIATDIKSIKTGSIVEVRSSEGDFLCFATFNAKAYIALRAISFEPGDPLGALRRSIKRAIDLRQTISGSDDSTVRRLINAEGDSIPGLIVDQYGDVLVVQLTTLGFERLRDWIAETLWELIKPQAIFEKSGGAGRKKEGLEPREGWLKGSAGDVIAVKERGLTYRIALQGSQKTGFFLDQREMRSLVRSLSAGRTVLDCCGYVGGFSVNALAGGALSADMVDYDGDAVARALEHVQINGMDTAKFSTYQEDVFDFLRRKPLPRQYDLIVLDPPAFAKRSSDIDQAKGAYTDMNRMALQAIAPGGLLLTCSCSYQMDSQLFQTAVFHAARQADRSVRILQRHRLAYDHPVNLYYPEGDYLKSLLLWVE